jgi:hypothetical protein
MANRLTSKTVALPLRERAKERSSMLGWVRGCFVRKEALRRDPLTPFPLLNVRVALSLKGRGHNNNHRLGALRCSYFADACMKRCLMA